MTKIHNRRASSDALNWTRVKSFKIAFMISVMTDLKQIDFWSLKYAGLCGPEVISIIHIPFLYFLVFVSTWQDDIMKQKKTSSLLGGYYIVPCSKFVYWSI